MESVERYRIFYNSGSQLIDNGIRYSTLSDLRKDFPESQYAIVLESDVPNNWSSMMVSNGELVNVSDEILQERNKIESQAELQKIDDNRKSEYETTTDKLLFDAIEQFAINHPEFTAFSTWLEEKNKIRDKYPKPEA